MGNNIISIPDFTKEEYFDTSLPYDFLYQYKDDKFLLKQMIQKMKDKAGSLGVKCFISLWNAYCETVASKAGISLDNSTQFEGQPVELFSGQYKCEESGVYFIDKFGYEVNVCRHPIMPIQRLCNADTGEERLEIAYKKGKNWRTVIVEKSVIASSSSILQLASYGILVNSENAKALSTYILEIENLNFDVIPEQQSISRLGWISQRHFSPYVEELVFDGETNFKHIFGSVKSSGSREAWVNVMRNLRSEKSPGRLFLAASFASVILEPCGLLPFFLHAWGGTETGKTVGLMIAASVWACPKLGDFVSTFNSTLVGQEMTASFLNSLPMCIDELQIQSSSGVRDFDRIIYQLTEGVGRTRGAKTGGLQRMNTWRNCIITNGEHPISNSSSGGGAVNRVIEFECDEKVYSDLVGICAVISSNYGFAGREFVEFLQQDGMFEAVNAIQKEYYRELLKSDSTDKQAASASAILAADAIATELIFKDGNNLTVADLEKIMTKKAEVNVNQRALEFVYELAERNPNRFKANEFGDYQGEVWGKKEDDCIYFIKSVFDREMANAGFNSTAFLAWAKRMGYIDTDKNKRTKKAWILGGSVNTVCVKKEKQPDEVTTIYDDELPI